MITANKNKIVNYNNVYTCIHVDNIETFKKRVEEHIIIYIKSGILKLTYDNKDYIYTKGDCIFVRRSHDISMIKTPSDDQKPFYAVCFVLTKSFLSSQFKKYSYLCDQVDVEPIIQIEKNPVITSFFETFLTYFTNDIQPSDEIIELKKHEALHTLLLLKPSLAQSLFDFAKPWKIDIESFMYKNFASDLTLQEFARYTGRSLSSFKRDFKEIFKESPHQWIKNKKLAEAYKLIKTNKEKASNIYLDLGFKSLSHFSNAFKDKFGTTPTKT